MILLPQRNLTKSKYTKYKIEDPRIKISEGRR